MTATPAKPRGNLVPDFIAGLTTGVANIPDAMASSILAGVSPVQGLYAIMVGTPLGALFSSSAFMNVAATSALSITAGSALAGYSVEQRPSAIATLALVTGVIMVLILDASAQDALDMTSSDVLKGLVKELRGQGMVVYTAEVHAPVIEFASRSGLLDSVGTENIFPTVDLAVAAFVERRGQTPQ